MCAADLIKYWQVIGRPSEISRFLGQGEEAGSGMWIELGFGVGIFSSFAPHVNSGYGTRRCRKSSTASVVG